MKLPPHALPVAAAIALGGLLVSLSARTQDKSPEGKGPQAKALLQPGCGTARTGPCYAKGVFFSLRIGFGTSEPFPSAAALELQGQVGWSLKAVTLGIVLEYNPFLNFAKPQISAGAYNFGAFLSYRMAVTPRLSLRFEGLAGGTTLLFDTYGYDRGDTGMWLGVKLLGIDLYRGKGFSVVVDLMDLTLPVYHVATMPFIYPQWRWSIGFAYH